MSKVKVKDKDNYNLPEKIKEMTTTALFKPMQRRGFLKGALTAAAAAVALPGAKAEAKMTLEKLFQKHYKEMGPEEKERVLKRIAAEVKEEYKLDVTVDDPQPMDGVQFAYFLNLLKCNGSRYCVAACKKENNTDDDFDYIKVIEMDRGHFNLEKGNMYYSGMVPKPGKFYMPVQCHQCDNPPCVKVCPVTATWKEKDGPVVIDYDWCIGCRYCMAACPYEARRFNFRKPQVKNINPHMNYLSNRIRPVGVTEKCTFCLHRTRKGLYPACLEACPTGSRKFGNLLDPKSEVSIIFREKKVYILKEELNTMPRFYYYFDE